MHLDMLLNSAMRAHDMQYLHEASPRTAVLAPLPSLADQHDKMRQFQPTSATYRPPHDPNYMTEAPQERAMATLPMRYLPPIHHHHSSFIAPLQVNTEAKVYGGDAMPMSMAMSISTPSHGGHGGHGGHWHHGREANLPSIHVKEEPYRSQTSVINASAIQRRLAIERRNLKRNIVPRHHVPTLGVDKVGPFVVDAKNTKNRESAAAYREKRDRKVKLILSEIEQIQKSYPSIVFRDWVPAKLPKSERKPGESKEDYRRRTNRESAAGSREQQKEKLHYLTQELARMRSLIPSES